MATFRKFHKEAYEKGRAAELALLPTLQEYFNDPEITHTENVFEKFDFYSPTKLIELKCRFVNKNTYKDIMINGNKIAEARKFSAVRDYYFVFKFNDGVWFWKFDPTVELDCRIAGRTDRGYDERQNYIFIPTPLLIPLIISP